MSRISMSIVFAGLLLASCSQVKTPPPPPISVNLYAVKASPVFYYEKFPGTTVALSQVDLRPEVQGYITGIYFKEGSHVEKGQKLYEIDQRLYMQNYDAAKANLKVAQGNEEQAQQDADRYTYLAKTDAIARQTLDHAVIALKNAKNQVEAAQQALKTAETNLTYSVIYAPFSGTIGLSQVKLGNLVSVGQTILNTISTDNPMAVDFLISEKELTHYEELKNSKLKPIDSLFTIVLPNGQVYPHLGEISVIDRAVDPQTGTITVRLVFPNPDYALRPGMSCVVRVHNLETTPQVLAPSRAVVELMGEYFVFTTRDTVLKNADDSSKTHPATVAIQKKVVLGQTIAPNVIVKSGLPAGTQIVVDGVQSLHMGSQVMVGKKPK